MIRGWSWLRSGREHWSWQVVEQTRRRRRRTRRRTRRAGNWHKRGKTQQQSWPTRPPQATAKNTTAELAHTAAPNISKKHNSRAGRHGRPTLAKKTTAELADTAAPNSSKKHNSRAGRHGRPKHQQKTQQQSWPTRPPQTTANYFTLCDPHHEMSGRIFIWTYLWYLAFYLTYILIYILAFYLVFYLTYIPPYVQLCPCSNGESLPIQTVFGLMARHPLDSSVVQRTAVPPQPWR